MDLALITTNQVIVLFILILAGFVSVKVGVIKSEWKKAFSELLIYLIVPAMILNSYFTDFNAEILKNLLKALGLSVMLILAGFIIILLFTIRNKDKQLPIIRFACTFSNAGYMGFPLVSALFGSEGLLYASMFVTIFNLFLWTIGIAMVSHQTSPKAIAKSIISTPVLITVVIGLIIFLCRIPVPSVIQQPISLLGSMNTPISMIITGIIIADSDIVQMLKSKSIYLIIVVRLIIIPAVSFGLLKLVGATGMVAQVVFLLEACPSAAITSIFAVQYDYDATVGAGAVVITTLLSIIALPLWALTFSLM